VSAARDLVYLPEANLGHPLLVLGIWLAGSLAVLACVDLLHQAERRRAPEREAEIYATPGTTHVRRRLARGRAAQLGQPGVVVPGATTAATPYIGNHGRRMG
jgi:hypothetical protein